MAQRTGSANLPLHTGRVPPWLAERMTRLGAVMSEAIVHHYGRDELLRRLAHPFWFQSFGAVMGMDWHSSGITTSMIGALKRGLAPLAGELGLRKLEVQARRALALQQAYAANPSRFRRPPAPPPLPAKVWINQPRAAIETQEAAPQTNQAA